MPDHDWGNRSRPETEWAVETDLGRGTTSTTPPMYRREHAERHLQTLPASERARSRVVRRVVLARPWESDHA
jgi:hypothetical protein